MKPIHVSGKRKRAIARATLKSGSGKIKINKIPLDAFRPETARLRITEPLILARDQTKKVNIDINVRGGGIASQVEASRLVIGKALSKFNSTLVPIFLEYAKPLFCILLIIFILFLYLLSILRVSSVEPSFITIISLGPGSNSSALFKTLSIVLSPLYTGM